jgi:hypothetical protein
MSKTPNEKQSRTNLLGWAKSVGCYADLVKLFNRYDDLLKGAKTNKDKKAIQVMAITELNKFFGTAPITNLQFKDGSVISLNDKNDTTITRGSRKDKDDK